MSLFPLGLISQGGGAEGGNALTLISTTILGSTTSTISFTGISSSYKHLQLRMTGRQSSSDTIASVYMGFNSDTGSNYAWHRLQGSGLTVTSGAFTSQTKMGIGLTPDAASTTNAYAGLIVDILDYANTNKNKTIRSFGGYAISYNAIEFKSGAWFSTSAVSSLSITGDSSFVAGSRFSLYGVRG